VLGTTPSDATEKEVTSFETKEQCDHDTMWLEAQLIYTVYRDKDWVETIPTVVAYPCHESLCRAQRVLNSCHDPSTHYWDAPSPHHGPNSR
jgi:hypothetical protein